MRNRPVANGYCWATRSWLGVDGIWQFLAHPGLPEPERSDESDRSGADSRVAGDDESAPDRVAESLGARQRSGLSP